MGWKFSSGGKYEKNIAYFNSVQGGGGGILDENGLDYQEITFWNYFLIVVIFLVFLNYLKN